MLLSESNVNYYGARKYEIDETRCGQRLDNFLIGRYKQLPKSRIYRMIRSGEVRINGGRVKAMSKLKMGDVVRFPPCHMQDSNDCRVNDRNPWWLEKISDSILFEDDVLMVIDKPAGISVHGSGYSPTGLIEMLQISDRWGHVELAHRLDRDTSGCLLLAKKNHVLRKLHQQFRERHVIKIYTAMVHGEWSEVNRIIERPLERYLMPNGERRVKVSEQGQSAKTWFTVRQSFKKYTVLKARLDGGRTHQIRVHCQSVGCPIIGDQKYGLRDLDKNLTASSMALHASEITFEHPIELRKVKVCSPLPSSFSRLIDRAARHP